MEDNAYAGPDGAGEPGEAESLRFTARAEYAVRAVVALARTGSDDPVKGESIARDQRIPWKFLTRILVDLRRAGIVQSHRGSHGGYVLGRPADRISVAEIVRAVTAAGGHDTATATEDGSLAGLWTLVQQNTRHLLESVTAADLSAGAGPGEALVPLTGSGGPG